MADPEQIYQEVLQEEQGKGVTPVVAEGRAKSARARAEEGSPHPKEPKWWPGAQPHFEGGDAGGEGDEADEEEVVEEEAEEAAPAEEPAAEEPAEEPAAEEPAEEPAAEEPAEEPAAEEPAEEKPAAPAAESPAEEAPAPAAEEPAAAPKPPAPAEKPAAAAAQPAAAAAAPAQPAGTLGVSHGTATGTRLRPEDEVSTEAQFEGQKAMYERRKLIDELVATGVPAVTAHDTDRPRTPWLAVLYLLIPLLVIFYLAGREDETVAEEGGGATETEAPAEGGGGGALVLVAEGTAWDTDTLTLTADEPTSLDVENRDPTVHNMSIYPDQDAAVAKQDPLFTGPDVAGGETATYEVDPLEAGEYAYICDYHTNMVGDLLVE